ncbi:diguanylate cyclase domain-containing protein [Paenibacillus sp. WLX1005]|uniref:diguanylate cyclase domain-containing protein n=1 Tax=unclassified Paenibacillus TaxID=185978 RepID=UPI0039841BBA
MEFSNELLVGCENESQLRLLIDMIPELIVLKDGEGRWLLCNQMVREVHKLTESEYMNKTDLELAEMRPELRSIFEFNTMTDEQTWQKGSTLIVEKSFVGYDGVERTWEVMKTPIFCGVHERNRLIIVSRNITDRKLAEVALQQKKERYQLIAENMTDVITILGLDRTVQYASPSISRALGYTPEELIQTERFQLVHPEDIGKFAGLLNEILVEKKVHVVHECRYRHKDGHHIWFEMNMSYVQQEDKDDYLLTVARNIEERKMHEQQLKSLAYIDPLTGVPNRRYLLTQLHQDIELAHQNQTMLGILYLDIDRFKQVNDTLGHEAGDSLLIQMVQRIASELGPMDTIARIGGDEFIVVLPLVSSRGQIGWMADTICQALQKPWQLDDQEVITASSVGVAMYPNDGTGAKHLLSCADLALYEAKRSGRAQVVFHEDIEHTQ